MKHDKLENLIELYQDYTTQPSEISDREMITAITLTILEIYMIFSLIFSAISRIASEIGALVEKYHKYEGVVSRIFSGGVCKKSEN